jgi:hypothetical protein
LTRPLLFGTMAVTFVFFRSNPQAQRTSIKYPHSESGAVSIHGQGFTPLGQCGERSPISRCFLSGPEGGTRLDRMYTMRPQNQACGLQDNPNKVELMLLWAATFSLSIDHGLQCHGCQVVLARPQRPPKEASEGAKKSDGGHAARGICTK